ncbi:MAG: FAD binding domain-containing protein, partial [Gammaproteobacteria bacterium]|nr:FAD binding domain-containing protein [Gammaproteobacteria bacterium]
MAEASKLLTELGDSARPLAGGQSLLALMKLRIDQPEDLVDIARIPGLATIGQTGGEIRIGALATHAAIAHADIASRVPIVGDCARGIA